MSRPHVLLLALFTGAVLLTDPLAARDRELTVAEDDLLAAELASIGVVPATGAPVAVLRVPDAGTAIPIFIGPEEARAIVMGQRRMETPRPLTHDLAIGIIGALDARLQRLVIDDLRDDTYHGVLEFRVDGRDDPVRVDTRPSDGLALAVRTGATVAIARQVLESAADVPFEPRGPVTTALGITVVAAEAELREALELPDGDGVLVSDSRGMAAILGIQAGAMIRKIDGRAVKSPEEFLESVQGLDREDRATIEFWHRGETREVEVPADAPSGDRGERGRDRV